MSGSCGHLTVRTDLVLAQTLLRNLLANALKFAAGQVVLSVESGASGSALFRVEHDGPLLSEAVVMAEDGKPIGATSGLGLQLCREICQVLGMQLTARAGTGGGTVFEFVLNAEGQQLPPVA